MRALVLVAAMISLSACGEPKPAFVPVDETPKLLAECETKWADNPDLRESCIAAVKSTPHWSRDPNGPKNLADTCKEQFPDNTTLQLECISRGIDAETNAKMEKAQRDAR